MPLTAFSSATEIALAIRARKTTATAVVDDCLARIARFDRALNAICTLDATGAMNRAREADAALARGELWGPLHGVPMSIKDALETTGLRTTGGHPPLADHVPARDASAVARLRSAGAVLLGKTNVPPLSSDFRADNPIFGRTNNPWNLAHTPGGSTGGGGAAVAAGLSAFDLGSDLAGSVRIPAHYCGLFGLKPTERRVPNTGHIPEPPGLPRAVRHLNTLGPLARSVDDLELILKVIAGPDESEWDVPPVPLNAAPDRPLRTMRFAWSTSFGALPVTAETHAAVAKLASDLAGLGCKVENTMPRGFDVDLAWETWGEIVIAERAATAPERVAERVAALNATLGGDVPVGRGSAKGARATLADYMASLTRRDGLIGAWERLYDDVDAFLCPVTVGPAVPHVPFGTPIDVDGAKVPYFLAGTAYTCIFNLTGSPVVVLPIARSKEGLPIGVQVVGRRWGEMALLALAKKLALITGPFIPPPGY
ncbi:MAG: amidase [Burkholderiales bacterium]